MTRGRGYQILEHPQIQQVLAPDFSESLPRVRVIVARHRAPAAGKPITVGKGVGEWVYELFRTTLDTDRFLVEDVLDLYHRRGAEDRSTRR